LPVFYAQLSRKLGDTKEPNLIYPTKRQDIFIHILASTEDNRHSYIPIEPPLTIDVTGLMEKVEGNLLALGVKLPRLDLDKNKEEQFVNYLDMVLSAGASEKTGKGGSLAQAWQNFSKGDAAQKLKLTDRELKAIRYLFVREKLGLGALEPLVADPYIEDISCSGLGNIFVEHKIFKSLRSSIVFPTLDDLDNFVLWLAERVKKPVTFRNPIADATLPDGSRINIVYGKEVSKRGSNFTIRKFTDVPISVFELVEFGSLNYEILAYLSLVIGNGMNVFVSGETASGKTTLLNALTAFIHPLAKVVSIEDTPELQVPHKNWIREVVQSAKLEDTSGAVTMFDLLKAALRQRPNEILVGEIRGPEGNIAFQAMQTGHSVMATFHAATVEKLIQRITGNPISVPKTYIDNLNVVILTSQVRLPGGKTGRRITGIAEIVGYDPMVDSFTFVEVFHWDETNDTFEFTGMMSSHILETKIAPRLGIPSNRKRRIYNEMSRRSDILKKLHVDMHVTGFYDVLDVLGKAQREGRF
jgi:flagellar protein FlaI